MATEFKLPDLGENIETADVIKLLVSEGDQIAADQAVVEVETDKATVEVPCPHVGQVSKIHVAAGDTIDVGEPLITIETTTADAPPPPEVTAPPETATEAAPEAAPEVEAASPAPIAADQQAPPPDAPPPAPRGKAAPAGPATRRLARELGVDIATIVGTGPAGRITRDDVIAAVRQTTAAGRAAVAAAPAVASDLPTPPGKDDADKWGPVRRDRIPRIRQTIAARTAESAATIPHVTNFDDADVTELEGIRKASKSDYEKVGVKLTSMPFLIKAVAQALRMHPVINASYDAEAGEIVYKRYVNVGVAVDTDRGLVVPNVRSADRMNIPQIAQSLMTLAEMARDNKFTIEDLRGGTFTISNLGAIGGSYATPIINAPEVAVLLVGRSRRLPVVVEDRIEPRLMMPLSLSYDHRLVDGGAAARFLNEVIALLESPGRLLLAP